MNNLEVGKCESCKMFWRKEQLKQFTLLKSAGDGLIRYQKFLCDDCYSQLDEGLKTQKTKREKGV